MSIYNDVDSRVSAYKGNPQALMQRYSMSQDLLDAIALSKIKTMKKAAQNEAIAEMAKHQGDDTVYGALEKELLEGTKEEVNPTKDTAQQATGAAQQQQRQQQAKLKQVLQGEQPDPRMSGIALASGANNPQYAGGGIVAFSEGDVVKTPEELAREERRRRQAAADRRAIEKGAGYVGAGLMDLLSLPVRGAAAVVDTATRPLRAYGLNVPTLSDSAIAGRPPEAEGIGGMLSPRLMNRVRQENLAQQEEQADAARIAGSEAALSARPPRQDRPPPPPRDDQQQQQQPTPQPAAAAAPPQRTGIGYLEQVTRDRSGVPTGLEAAYRQQAESAVKADPEKIAEAERTRALSYLEGPNAEADRKARADEVARRRAVAEQSQAGASRRELIAGLIGAGGRTSNLGALMAGGAGAVNAAMRNEAAQEQALRDIFGMEETDRLRGLEMRKGAYGAGQAAQTESTRARTSAVSSVGQYLTQSEQNQFIQIKGMAEAIDRENARILEEAKYKQRAGEIKDAKTFEGYQAAEREYNRVVLKWEELKKGPEYTRAAQMLQNLGREDKKGESDMVRQQRQNAANVVLTFEKNAADARAAAHNQVKLAAQRAGIQLGSVSSRSDGVEEEMRRRGLLGGR